MRNARADVVNTSSTGRLFIGEYGGAPRILVCGNPSLTIYLIRINHLSRTAKLYFWSSGIDVFCRLPNFEAAAFT